MLSTHPNPYTGSGPDVTVENVSEIDDKDGAGSRLWLFLGRPAWPVACLGWECVRGCGGFVRVGEDVFVRVVVVVEECSWLMSSLLESLFCELCALLKVFLVLVLCALCSRFSVFPLLMILVLVLLLVGVIVLELLVGVIVVELL